MPNWCSTTYKIFGEKEELDELTTVIDALNDMTEPRVENGFGKLWLGCLVDALGGDWQEIYCRGDITSYCRENNYLRIDTETAWEEMDQVRHFLEEKYPTIRIYYISEEPGMCEYYTNDKYGSVFHTKYAVDFEDYDYEYFETIEDAAKWINSIPEFNFNVEPTVESIREAFDKFEEENEDRYIQFIEFEYDER